MNAPASLRVGQLAMPGLLIPGERVPTPQGGSHTAPGDADWRAEAALTREQETLFDEFCRLNDGEEANGRRLTIERKVKRLELAKHPLLRVWNKHLQRAPAPRSRSIFRAGEGA